MLSYTIGLPCEAFVISVETEEIMITENGRTRLEPGEQEKFFKKQNGKIVFLAHSGAGVDHAVDNSDEHRRMAKHFNDGDGWPIGHPEKIDTSNIWDAFKRTPSAN